MLRVLQRRHPRLLFTFTAVALQSVTGGEVAVTGSSNNSAADQKASGAQSDSDQHGVAILDNDADLSAEDAMSDLLMCLGLEEQKTQL